MYLDLLPVYLDPKSSFVFGYLNPLACGLLSKTPPSGHRDLQRGPYPQEKRVRDDLKLSSWVPQLLVYTTPQGSNLTKLTHAELGPIKGELWGAA